MFLARRDWKKQLIFRYFLSSSEVIAAAETWLDGQPSELFLGGLQKSLVAVACFLPGRAKDLSAPRYDRTSKMGLEKKKVKGS
jgi:hypothetical protein